MATNFVGYLIGVLRQVWGQVTIRRVMSQAKAIQVVLEAFYMSRTTTLLGSE